MPDTDRRTEAGSQPAGTLVSWTIIRKPPAAFADEPLYAIAIVETREGERVTGRLDPFEPQPTIGAPVRQVGLHAGVPVFAEVER